MADQHIIRRYSGLARAALAGETIRDCGADDFDQGSFGASGYDDLLGLPAGATRASLGCGNPLTVADLHAGEIVLDLGSGGGIDVLLSARRVGPDGWVYGLDASADMLQLARRNARQAGAANVEFLLGSIDTVPLPREAVDVVISNCVINLASDKAAVFAEIARVLRPAGRLGISDVIADDDSPPKERMQAALRVGCMAGVLTIGEYRRRLLAAGLVDLSFERTADHGDGVHSAVVQATKPMPAS